MPHSSQDHTAASELRSASCHGRTWWAALGADRFDVSLDEYTALVHKAEVTNSVEIRTIEKDVRRTFADRPEFRWLEPRLRRVLRSYSLRNTYCQGMSFVAAILLQHLPEACAFCCLATIVEDFLPPGYFTDELQGVYMDQHIEFAIFLPYRLPKLAAHFRALEVPTTLIGMRWFLCLFCADMEPLATAQFWDVLFSHGTHMLFAVALDLLATAEETLLAASDVAELFVLLRNLSHHRTTWGTLFVQAASFPSEADVAVARARYREEREYREPDGHPLQQEQDAGGEGEHDQRGRRGSLGVEHVGLNDGNSSHPRSDIHRVACGPLVVSASKFSLEAARAEARDAALLLLYEHDAVAAAFAQSGELDALVGGDERRAELKKEILPDVELLELGETGYWGAVTPALKRAESLLGRVFSWFKKSTSVTSDGVHH
eukprot:scaffold47344_cov33-Tisochrysis_lutea.AAC.1